MTTTKKCRITQVGPSTFKIILIQGLNRQIRRMCEYVGLHVIKLERTRIMHISLGKLPLGEWRDLSAEELEVLYQAVEGSSSEGEVPANAKGRGVTKASPKPKPAAPKPAGFKPGRTGKSPSASRGSKPRSGGNTSAKGRGGKPGRRR